MIAALPTRELDVVLAFPAAHRVGDFLFRAAAASADARESTRKKRPPLCSAMSARDRSGEPVYRFP